MTGSPPTGQGRFAGSHKSWQRPYAVGWPWRSTGSGQREHWSHTARLVDNCSMGLEVAFRSKELRSTCESPAKAKRELGEGAAAALRRYLADLEAAETVAELVEMGLDFENCGSKVGLIRFGLSEGRHLYCEVNHQHVPMSGEAVDWSKVSRLKVIHIGGDL